MSTLSKPSGIAKCAIACEYCRAKKIKCDANQPCKSCTNHGRGDLCYYPPSNSRRSARERHSQLRIRLQRAEALLHAAGLQGEIEMSENIRPQALPQNQRGRNEVSREQERRSYVSPSSSVSFYPLAEVPNNPATARTGSLNQISKVPGGTEDLNDNSDRCNSSEKVQQQQPLRQSDTALPSPSDTYNSQCNDIGFSSHSNNSGTITLPISTCVSHNPQRSIGSGQRSGSIAYNTSQPLINTVSNFDKVPHTESNQLQSPAVTIPDREESPTQIEIHGLGSFLSICSPAGVQWVLEKTGSSNFAPSARSLASSICRSLKLQRNSKVERIHEPESEAAWKYTQAYFNESLEGSMNAVHRATFEARLRYHLESNENTDEDPAWYALRNIVYAIGSRIVHYEETSTWAEAQKQGWKYFQNALSVHTDLVYCWSSIAAVQALFVMASFVEGIGAPKLEYMLISNALRLAQGKGLQLQPSPASKLPEMEIQNRSWLFWSIYVYEKHISFRARRPSAINDDEIDCPLPTTSPDGNASKVELFRHVIYHAQISSAVMKELLSFKSRRKSPNIIAEAVHSLEARLYQWRDILPSYLKPQLPINTSALPPGIFLEHKLWIYFSYHSSLSAIHSVFACPWNFSNFGLEHDEVTNAQIDQSMRAVADSSRKTILATRSITVTAAAQTWLTFLFPFLGVLNLFTYVLNFPSLPSVQSDIDLLDMAAGYFGYLGFSTLSQVSFSFAKDISQWARDAVIRSQQPQVAVDQLATSRAESSTNGLQPLDEFGDLSHYDFGFDKWPFFQT